MHRISIALTTVAVGASSLVASSCGDDGEASVLVLAAASLTDAFTTMADEFESEHPDVDVQVSFGGSSTLQVQVEEGAPADIVAFADGVPVDALAAEGLVDDPVVFATNSVVLVTPTDNPGGVTTIDDLADPDLLVGVCAPQVPCGRYAREVLSQSGVDASVDTEEPDVRSLAAKVASGELDAALVYATDVEAFDGELATIPLPDGVDVGAEYPIAVLDDSSAADGARLFVDFVLSPTGQAVLSAAGFGSGSGVEP